MVFLREGSNYLLSINAAMLPWRLIRRERQSAAHGDDTRQGSILAG